MPRAKEEWVFIGDYEVSSFSTDMYGMTATLKVNHGDQKGRVIRLVIEGLTRGTILDWMNLYPVPREEDVV